MTEQELKRARGNAQRKFDEIARYIVDGPNSLTQHMVKAYRQGLPKEKADELWKALRMVVIDAEETYDAAIAQPEPKVSNKPRIQL